MPIGDPFLPRRKKFHKKKVTENASEAEGDFFSKVYNPDATRDRGIYCRTCRRRIPWKDLNTDYSYSNRTKSTYRQWFCGYCGNQIREDDMTDLSLVFEVDDSR